MANWAIVIGIDRYWEPGAWLRGGVRDALAVREWLLDPKGGDVPAENLVVLLSPTPDSVVPPGLQAAAADYDGIVTSIDSLIKRSNGKGERLFFHFSGHGLVDRIAFTDVQALVPTDFTDLLTTRALKLQDILDVFEATQFAEQYFFIDACRNIPWQQEFRIGEYPRPAVRDPNAPAVQQFAFYATSPRLTAAEIGGVSDERGAFTAVLLDGLQGKGAAKAWDAGNQEYVVRVDRLLDYLVSQVSARIAASRNEPENRRIQVPRLAGERGSIDGSNPVIARFPVDGVPKETLDVFIDPTALASDSELVVERESAQVASLKGVANLPASFSLQPKEYSLRASALNWVPAQKSWVIELYERKQVTVKLIAQPVAVGPGGGLGAGPAEAAGAGPPVGTAFAPQARGLGGIAHLTVVSADHLAPLDVTNAAGELLKVGQGIIQCDDLAPGFYVARLRTPEGRSVEKRLELAADDDETVTLEPPPLPQTGLLANVIGKAQFTLRPDNTLEVSESTGPIAAAHLSTILALAGSAVTSNLPASQAVRLRSLGVTAFGQQALPNAPSGLEVLLGAEGTTSQAALDFVSQIRLRVWALDEAVPDHGESPSPLPSVAGLAQFSRPAGTGPHCLAVEVPGADPVVFMLAMLPQRITMLVFHFGADGRARVFQYLPSRTPDGSTDPRTVRRLELVQRFYLNGRLDYAYETAKDLLQGKWEEPIAGCLGGYLLLKQGKGTELASPASNMTIFYPELSDGYVLQGEAAESLAQPGAERFSAALDHGFPIFSDGLVRLNEAVQRYQIDHPRVALLRDIMGDRAPGMLWSAWVPERLEAGKTLMEAANG